MLVMVENVEFIWIASRDNFFLKKKISYSENFVWQVIMDVIVTFPLS